CASQRQLHSFPTRRSSDLALLKAAINTCQELGMRALEERVTALLAHTGSESRRASTHPNGLTRREVEVLRLIAVGKSNRDIADRSEEHTSELQSRENLVCR